MAHKTLHVIQPELTLLSPEALSGGHLPAVRPTIGDNTGSTAELLHLHCFQHCPQSPR